MILFWIVLSTFLVSLIALISIIAFLIKEEILEKVIFFLISLSIGALMATAFFHLIPEALELEKENKEKVFLIVIVGFLMFFIVEKIFHWRHCHEKECPIHSFAYINLLGDIIHNFIDGLIIAAAFLENFPLGVITTFAVIIHEIPHELGNFGVLVYGGFKKSRAVILNFATAIFAILGGIIGFYLYHLTENFISFLIPFSAGGFIYIAASDLIPETRKETNPKKILLNFIILGIGIIIIYGLKFLGIE
jgi:zinc and cadmium transporter